MLEGVRQVKHELNRLQTRVQRVKQELEEILEDDDDMAVRECCWLLFEIFKRGRCWCRPVGAC